MVYNHYHFKKMIILALIFILIGNMMKFQALLKKLVRYQWVFLASILTSQVSWAEGLTHGAFAEGQLLPENVFKINATNKWLKGTDGYDKAGKPLSKIGQDLGNKLNVGTTVFELSYGITERLSLSIGFPLIHTNKMTQDKGQFAKSRLFRDRHENAVNQLADKLAPLFGNNKEAAKAHILADKSLASQLPIPLPTTGEVFSIAQGQPINSALKQGITNAADRPAEGHLGMGDLQFGGLYNFLTNDQWRFTAGLGMRIPTGNDEIHHNLRPFAASGLFAIGTRVNLDYAPVDGIWLSVQSQLEHALGSSLYQRHSDLNPSSYNQIASPLDGKANLQRVKSGGFYSSSFVQAKFGMGAVSNYLKPLTALAAYSITSAPGKKYDGELQDTIPGVVDSGRSMSHNVKVGGGITGVPYQIPLVLDASYEFPIAGSNQALAMNDFTMTLTGYFSF